MAISTDILIVGAGPVGATAAIALADAGWDVTLVAPASDRPDPRTTAYLWQTKEYLEELGIWQSLEDLAFPLKTMRIVDGTNRLFRAPQTDFNSSEINLEAFGYNVKNADVLTVLNAKIGKTEAINLITGEAVAIHETDGSYRVEIVTDKKTKTIEAGFIIGADGRQSFVRQSLLPDVRQWDYPQTALVVDFENEYPTNYVSTEFHTETGPFTIVPRSQNLAGLVWLEKPERVAELLKLSNSELEAVLESRMQSFLGKITLKSKPAAFPIKGLVANKFGKGNVALIGEAAHVFPPIGAQGFNLGSRDIQDLVKVMSRHTNLEDRGAIYDKLRKSDIETRTRGVDMLNRSLISDFLPNQLVRTLGLYVLNKVPQVRKTAMKMGISPIKRLNG